MLYVFVFIMGMIIGWLLGLLNVVQIFQAGNLEISDHEGDTYMTLKLSKELSDVRKRKYALLRVENVSYYEN